MSDYGLTIQTYFRSGDFTGIRHAEIHNRTPQAIACPRSALGNLEGYLEASDVDAVSGVYILFGRDKDHTLSAYVGASDDVLERIVVHTEPDELGELWTEVVFFVNKDDNLGKSDSTYLEARLCAEADSAGRFKLWNHHRPNPPVLPLPRRESLNEFFRLIKLLLVSLGHRILAPERGTFLRTSQHLTQDLDEGPLSGMFEFSGNDFAARGHFSHEGFTVKQGSLARVEESDSFQRDAYNKTRDQLIDDGTLEQEGPCYRFTEDVLFTSSTAAASVVAGSRRSGTISWVDDQGRFFGELRDEAMEAALA